MFFFRDSSDSSKARTRNNRHPENSKTFETLQNCSSSDANNVTIFCFDNDTVIGAKTPLQTNFEFSYYRKYLRNRKGCRKGVQFGVVCLSKSYNMVINICRKKGGGDKF